VFILILKRPHLVDHRRVDAAMFGSLLVKGRRVHLMFLQGSGTGTPRSAWRRIARICGGITPRAIRLKRFMLKLGN
jgi:hypothetical protein